MRTLVEIGLLNALLAGVPALLVLAARKRCRPALVHALWVLAFVKLLTPPLWRLPVLAAEDEPAPAAAVARLAARAPRPTAERPAPVGPFTLSKDLARAAEAGELPPPPPAENEPAAGADAEPSAPEEEPADVPPPVRPAVAAWSVPGWLFDVIGAVWLAGAAAWFLVTGRRVVRFHRLLRYAATAPVELQTRCDELARRLGLRRGPEVRLLPGPLPPLLWAVGGRPRLFFPRALWDRLDADGRDALLLHELAHLRRRDHWVRAIEWLALGLYWWDPLVWYGCRALHAAEEECCDAWVVGELPAAAPAYAAALLETVDFLADVRAVLPPAASGFGRTYSLKRRLAMILHGSTPRGLPPAGRFSLLALALVLAPLSLGRAGPELPSADGADKPAAATADEPLTVESQPRPLLGSGGQIWSVTVSPDGKLLAVGSGGSQPNPGDLALWDLDKGEEIAALREAKPVRCVAFSPDGETLATAEFDNTLKLRDPHTGAVRRVLRGHTDRVNYVAFTPDGKTLLSAGLDKSIRLWDPGTGAEQKALTGLADWVLSVAVARDGTFFVCGSRDQTATIWGLPSGEERRVLKGHTAAVESVAVSPDGKTVATASADGTVKLWDAATGEELRTLAGHAGAVDSVRFSPDGKALATGGSDNTVRLWDPAAGESTAVLEGHTGRVYALAFAPDGKTLVSGSFDRSVKLWDMTERKEKTTLTARAYRPENSYPLLSIAASPDGKLLAVSGEEKAIRLVGAADGRDVRRLEGHDDVVARVAFAPDGKTLASAGFDQAVKLWDVATGKELATLKGHHNWVFAVAFSPDGKVLASAGYDKTVRLWDTATHKPLAILKGHRGGVRAVAFAPDGKTLASAGSDRTVKLWDVSDPAATKEPKTTLRGHEGAVRCLAFSPDGKALASGGEDNTVRLWELSSGKQLATHQHGDMVLAVAFSPQGAMLVSSGQDRTTRILDPHNANQRTLLRNHTDAVTCLCFAPDGKALYTGSADKTVKLWPAVPPPMRPVATVRDHGNQTWVALFTPDNKSLITAGADKTVKVRPRDRLGPEAAPKGPAGPAKTAPPAEDVVTLTGHTAGVACAALAPGGKVLATGGFDTTIRLWDLAAGKQTAVLTGHKDAVRCLAFAPDGKVLASASSDKTVRLWDVASGREKAVVARFEVGAAGVAFSPDGKTLALCASHDSNANMPGGGIKLWDVRANRAREGFAGANVSALGVAFSPDGKLLASSSPASPAVQVWDVAGGKLVKTLQESASVRHLAFSPDGKLLATGHGNGGRRGEGSVQLWDTTTWAEVAHAQAQRPLVVSVAFSPDGRTLATAGLDGSAMLWDVAAARALARKDK